jgi:hypothetical protein
MSKIYSKDLNAIVIGAGTESIYTISKTKDMEFKVIAFDGDKNTDGFKYADKKKFLPHPLIVIIKIQVGSYCGECAV